MNRIIFLVEEASMKTLLDGLLPRQFPSLSFLCVPHEGKPDLKLSIPKKLRSWNEPGVRFVVICDNDSGDCGKLKADLRALCLEGGRDDVLVRIVCQELEAWYLAEPDALADVFENKALRGLGNKRNFRDPDAIRKPSKKLKRLIPAFQKTSGARRLALHLTRERNGSKSFKALMLGLDRIAAKLDVTPKGEEH